MDSEELKSMTRERLAAWRDLHAQAVNLAREYGRRAPKDEEALRRIDVELAIRDRQDARNH